MSVTGEFHRLVRDCVAYLEASNAERAEPWARGIEAAAALSEDSLDRAAEDALRLLADGERTPGFAELRERDEFGELAEHLAAICRAIIGQPADSPTQGRNQP